MSPTPLDSRAVLGFLAIAALGVASPVDAQEDPARRAELQALAGRRVFFAHQSVGTNVLEGLRQLAAASGVELRIAEARAPGGIPPDTFGHGLVAENGDPRRKLRSFEEAFASGAARGAEIALLKLCYVDFQADADVAGLFAEYQATLARLRARHPGVAFVHVTAPLVTTPGGVRSSLKALLGRPSQQLLENLRRDDYNALLRRAYAGKEPLFDLAAVEARRPDGSLEAVDWQGRAVPALVAGYSDDGGHLNRDGQLRAARELVRVLASIPRAGAPAAGVGR